MKKVLKFIGKFFSFIGITILGILVALILIINLFCRWSSDKTRDIFVTTMLETGQLKFVVGMFMDDDVVKKIVESNSLKAMSQEIDEDLIEIDSDIKKEPIKIEDINGGTFRGKMMIISDPSKVYIASTYPWSEYGEELGKLVEKSGAIGGINGGLYISTANKGGYPVGVVVSKGQIQYNNTGGYAGLYLIGLDNKNLLRIIEITKKSKTEIEKLVKEEGIRDAIAFQDEYSDKNNHFVKLIINGEKRELNGLGSGANPRTVIGQRKDGTILMLVTDGRGDGGHLGATAADLIDVMSKYGAVNAANLDGGSSTSMYYNGEYLKTSVTMYYANSSWRIPTAFVVRGDE